MLKDKQGNQLSAREFFKKWKQGIEGITPLQICRIEMQGTSITMLGIFLGVIISFFNLQAMWWLIIILVGALIVTSMQFLAQIQKYINLNRLFNIEMGLESNEQKSAV